MRTLELLNSLNEREFGEVSDLVKGKKRKSLLVLFTELEKYVKRDNLPTNEDLFSKVFKETYSSSKNYLLRNELRLLNEIIYDYLVRETFSTYLKKHRSTYHVWLARTFFDRQLKGAFNADIDRFIAYAKEHVKAEDSALLNDLKSLWMIYTYDKNEFNLKAKQHIVEEWKSEQIRHLKYRLREAEARNAYLHQTLNSVTGNDALIGDDTRTEPQPIVDLTLHGSADAFENYLVLKKYTYQTKGLKRIEIIKQMLHFEESKEYNTDYQGLDAQLSSLNSIAMEYISLGDFDKANYYMLDAIERARENQQHLLPALLQNFIGNQVNLGTYQTALDFYTLHETEIKANRQFAAICIYRAFCHLFLGHADEALAALPKSNSLTPHQSLMLRMVYLIAFILRGQHDIAINESYNISRMAKANEGIYHQNYFWINSLYAKYLDALIMERDLRKIAMNRIKDELDASAEKVKSLLGTEFALRWLIQAVNRS